MVESVEIIFRVAVLPKPAGYLYMQAGYFKFEPGN
jgi:hypothetical protein